MKVLPPCSLSRGKRRRRRRRRRSLSVCLHMLYSALYTYTPDMKRKRAALLSSFPGREDEFHVKHFRRPRGRANEYPGNESQERKPSSGKKESYTHTLSMSRINCRRNAIAPPPPLFLLRSCNSLPLQGSWAHKEGPVIYCASNAIQDDVNRTCECRGKKAMQSWISREIRFLLEGGMEKAGKMKRKHLVNSFSIYYASLFHLVSGYIT